MNWFDIVTLIFSVYFGITGFMRGLVSQLLSLVGTIVSLIVSYKTYDKFYEKFLNTTFDKTEFIGKIVAFVIIFMIVKIILKLIAYTIEGGMRITHLSPLNKIGGLVLGIIKALTISSFIFILVNGILGDKPFESSKLIPLIDWYINIVRKLVATK